LEKAADYISDTLKSYGLELSEQHFPENGHVFRNVIATLGGRQCPEQRVLVMAHYDTVPGSPGADDNASGVAVMLELARILQPLGFERTIHFIGVSLEENACEEDPESGTRGSGALAAYAKKADWQIDAVIVLESVAFAGNLVVQRTPPNVPVPVPKTGNFIAVVGNELSTELVTAFTETIDRLQLPLPYAAMTVPGNGGLLPDSRRSDHAPFWDAGYRAIMVTDTTNFRSPHYHRPSDTLDTLNLEFAENVCCAAAGFIIERAGRVT
jgi:Zn-dependent M28 family amino/carboxypeptidase